jgi:hypothetical protein
VNRRYLFVAALLIVPGIAFAQRGGGKSRATEPDKMFDKANEPKGLSFRSRDMEELSPLRRLVDKRKDIQLNDSQVDALKKSEDALRKTNEPNMKALDSLVREMRPPLNMTPEAKSRIDDAGYELRETVKKISESYENAAKEAVASMTPEQQTKANEVLARLKEDSDKTLREKLGGRGRG